MNFDYPLASDQLLDQIRRRIAGAEWANLITCGPEGYPRARAMEDHNVEEDFVFFFETDASTRKVGEVAADPKVTISYYCPDSHDYICLFGAAEIVTDEKLKAARWRDGWESYWPGGPTDPGYVVMRVVAEALEYYDMEAKQLRKVSIPRLSA